MSRNLEQEFRVQEKVPSTTITGLTTSLPHVSLFSESTRVISDKQQETQGGGQFRMASVNTNATVQPHTLGFSGNSGYFAPITAPLFSPPHTYNPITGQYINMTTTAQGLPPVYQAVGNLYDLQRNQHAT